MTRLIKFYKGVILVKVHEKLVADGNYLSIDEVDDLLKEFVDNHKSCSNMDKWELLELCSWSLAFANNIGLDLDWPEDELDKKINLDIK